MRKALLLFVFLIILFSVFIEFFHPLNAITQDLGRHIKMGEITVNTHSVSKINLFSYTYPNFKTINTHWFSEVVFYVFYKLSGFGGLLILTTVIALFAVFMILTFSKKNALPIPLAMSAFLYLGILSERTDLRPEIFSLFFLSLFVTILYKQKEKFTKLIFILPFIELLWVNMHIYFIVGVFLIFLFLLDNLLKERERIKKSILGKKPLPKETLYLLCVGAFSILAAFVNPYGAKAALYPFFVFSNYGYPIEENQTIFFLQSLFFKPTILFFEIIVVVLFALLFINARKTKFIDWLIVLSFSVIAFLAERNLVLFVFATFIPFSKYLSNTYTLVFSKINPVYLKSIFTILIIGAFIWESMFFIAKDGFGFKVPKGAGGGADFFLSKNLHGPIFNGFDIGSYLDYRLYPKTRVFVDGRPEAYPSSFFTNIYMPMQEDPSVFKKIDQKYGFNTIFFDHIDQTPWASQFLRQIVQDPLWRTVYLDDSVIILVKNNSLNKDISGPSLNDDNFNLPKESLKDKRALFQFLHFFLIVGWSNQETKVLYQLLSLDPNDCIALYNLATLSKDSNLQNLYLYKYQKSCKGD